MATEEAIRIDEPPHVSLLSAGYHFGKLTSKEKFYAHHLARAAWHGTSIILRQVSPESHLIFDFILELYRSCDGNWKRLALKTGVLEEELQQFLNYAAVFLGNMGNYFGHGDQKFVPNVTSGFLQELCSISTPCTELYQKIAKSILAPLPRCLGFASDSTQSAYYFGLPISQEAAADVSSWMEAHSIHPENTSLHRVLMPDGEWYVIYQASIEDTYGSTPRGMTKDHRRVRVRRGHFGRFLNPMCRCMEEAQKFAANPLQERYLSACKRSFETGNMECFKESQRIWVKDIQSSVEVILGFIEPYRDPLGTKAEFEGIVGIVDKRETEMLAKLAQNSDKFVRRLPWVGSATENNGKGPFEKAIFESPDFTSLHTLAYTSSTIFPGVNLPNYNDIRQDVGSKNMMITNMTMARSPLTEHLATYLETSDVTAFIKHRGPTMYLWVVFHELLGHGTGKLLMDDGSWKNNFDKTNPPLNPLTGQPITSWYDRDQTWTGLFRDIATTVDECRAECVGAYLMSEMDLLEMFGYTEYSEITGRDLEYNIYLQLGISGLRALENYMAEDQKWGQAHSRAHFAIFQTLLAAPGDFLTVTHRPESRTQPLIVKIDRTKIASQGRPALSELLLRLHIYRCTADVQGCRTLYEALTKVDETSLKWRQSVLAHHPPRQVYVQPNTMLEGGKVVLKDYEASVEGVIKSWAERMVDLDAQAGGR